MLSAMILSLVLSAKSDASTRARICAELKSLRREVDEIKMETKKIPRLREDLDHLKRVRPRRRIQDENLTPFESDELRIFAGESCPSGWHEHAPIKGFMLSGRPGMADVPSFLGSPISSFPTTGETSVSACSALQGQAKMQVGSLGEGISVSVNGKACSRYPVAIVTVCSNSASSVEDTDTPCTDGVHGCDTRTTECVIRERTEDCDYYVCECFLCECKKGFEGDPMNERRCIAMPTAVPSHMPTEQPCSWAETSSCDTASTIAVQPESGICVCMCLEGFVSDATDEARTACIATDIPTAAPSREPSHMPTLQLCGNDAHGCDSTTTVAVEAGASGCVCQCLEGFVVNVDDVRSCRATGAPTVVPTTIDYSAEDEDSSVDYYSVDSSRIGND
jgi:hypothetical protein